MGSDPCKRSFAMPRLNLFPVDDICGPCNPSSAVHVKIELGNSATRQSLCSPWCPSCCSPTFVWTAGGAVQRTPAQSMDNHGLRLVAVQHVKVAVHHVKTFAELCQVADLCSPPIMHAVHHFARSPSFCCRVDVFEPCRPSRPNLQSIGFSLQSTRPSALQAATGSLQGGLQRKSWTAQTLATRQLPSCILTWTAQLGNHGLHTITIDNKNTSTTSKTYTA